MDNQSDFTSVLRAFMGRAVRTPTDLTRLTGLSPHTLRNWIDGKVRRPRVVNDVLKLAHGLALDVHDTTALLTAAGHPPLQTLQVQAQQTDDPQLIALLAFWLTVATNEPGGTAIHPHPPPTLAPRHQLRPPIKDFVGRDAEINELVTTLRTSLIEGQGAIISGVQGMGGIGKTELAYTVAHRLRDVFPDAQILLNLRGTSTTPLTPSQALQIVIRTFAPDSKLPDDQDLLQQHYQTVLEGQRVLILADDARDAAQVWPLLPPASCALLITSRMRFTLPGMTTVDLEQLPSEAASMLLRMICLRLSEAEAQALARACGSLPLALRISGGLLRTTPALAVADYLRKLADAQQRLKQLRDPDDRQLDVVASLALSYAQLDAATQAVFRQLGALVADFSTALAVNVVEVAAGVDVEALLYVLLRRNLVMYDRERGRWRLHDLLRDLAHSYLEAAGELEAAQWRYARAAVQIAQETQAQYLAGGDGVLAALARFDAERMHIDATRMWVSAREGAEESDRLILDAAVATTHIGRLRYDWQREILPQWERALAAARRLGDRGAEGLALNNLGVTYVNLGDCRRAIPYHTERLTIARAIGDQLGESTTLNNLGIAYMDLGEAQCATPYLEQSLAIARTIGDRLVEGVSLHNLANAYTDMGQAQRALPYYEQALALVRAIGHRFGEGVTLGHLGNAYADLGETQRAVEACEMSLSMMRAIGDRREEGYALSYLARAQAQQGDCAHATSAFVQALALLREVGDRHGEAECGWRFGLALAGWGERERALPLLRAAMAYEQEIGHVKAAEHAALLARLEVGEPLPPELRDPAG